jgi:hypothetical protein
LLTPKSELRAIYDSIEKLKHRDPFQKIESQPIIRIEEYLKDSDKDGTPDGKDKCPKEPGDPQNGGCPLPPSFFFPDMVLVRGGTFRMGSARRDKNAGNNEKPAHNVTLSDFYIGRTEVTQALWRKVMGTEPSNLSSLNCDQCPIENVNWRDIQLFLQKLNTLDPNKNYRLPSEAEWEFAARGGQYMDQDFIFAGSNNIDEVSWYFGNAKGRTHPVSQKKANNLGLYDMSGNVYELCSDWYADYTDNDENNPSGPKSGTRYVIRGGAWSGYAQYSRVANRYYTSPSNRNQNQGFRLAYSRQ